jgi:DnaJ-class molecular chaperone
VNANHTETITCGFCRGTGTDPYGQLSSRSRCEVCWGTGRVWVPVPHIRCTYCRGTGSHKTFSCPVCGGKARVAAPGGPVQPCPDCEGLSFESSSGLYCERCKGRGFVPAEREPSGCR